MLRKIVQRAYQGFGVDTQTAAQSIAEAVLNELSMLCQPNVVMRPFPEQGYVQVFRPPRHFPVYSGVFRRSESCLGQGPPSSRC